MSVEDVLERLRQAQGDPHRLTLATVDSVLASYGSGLREAVEAVAIPHWFDERILAALTSQNIDSARETVQLLKTLPFVESSRVHRGFNIHDLTRQALRRRMLAEDPERFNQLSLLAAALFRDSDQPAMQVERLFHLLSAGDFPARNRLPVLSLRSAAGRFLENAEIEVVDWLDIPSGELHVVDKCFVARIEGTSMEPVVPDGSLAVFRAGPGIGSRQGRWVLVEERQGGGANTYTLKKYRSILSHDSQEVQVQLLPINPSDEVIELEADTDSYAVVGEFIATVRAAYDWSHELDRTYRDWDRAGKREAIDQLAAALTELSGFPLEDELQGRVLLILGFIRMNRIPLADSLRLGSEALRLLDAANLPAHCADAHLLLGDLLQREGQTSLALDHCQAGQRIWKTLTSSVPGNTAWQRELAVSHNNTGEIYQAQGKLSDALIEFQASKSILESLAEMRPLNSALTRELAVSHNNIGSIYQAQGHLGDALVEYQSSRRIRESLTSLNPANTDFQRDLAVCHDYIGGVYQAQGQLTDAMLEFQQGLRIMESLVALDPANTAWQRELGVSFNRVGGIYQAQRKFDDALAAFQSYKRILQSLTALDPANSRWRRELSVAHNNVGGIYQAKQQLPQALIEYQAAQNVRQSLVNMDPANWGWLRDLSASHNYVGGVHQAQSQYDLALSDYQAAKAIREFLSAMNPTNKISLRDLTVSMNLVGGVFKLQGHFEVALSEYQSAKTILSSLTSLDPSNSIWQRDLAVTYSKSGGVLEAQGLLQAALGNYQSAESILNSLITLDPTTIQLQDDLLVTRNAVRTILEKLAEAGLAP